MRQVQVSHILIRLASSVTSSFRLAWGSGHQDGLSSFQILPRFVNIALSLPPSLSSTFLSERGTLMTSGIFSSASLGSVSFFQYDQSRLFSSSRTSTAPPPQNSYRQLLFPNPRKACRISPSHRNVLILSPFRGLRIIFCQDQATIHVMTLADFFVGEPPCFIKFYLVFQRQKKEPSPLAVPLIWYTFRMTVEILHSIALLPLNIILTIFDLMIQLEIKNMQIYLGF